MKNFFKLFEIIVITAIFVFVSCDNGSTGSGKKPLTTDTNGKNLPDLSDEFTSYDEIDKYYQKIAKLKISDATTVAFDKSVTFP